MNGDAKILKFRHFPPLKFQTAMEGANRSGVAVVSMSFIVSGIYHSPCCQDADQVHQKPGPHHVSRLEAAGAVTDGVRARGYREHEGVTHTNL